MILEKVYDELYGMIEDLKKKIKASDVDITPALDSGTKIADYVCDGESGSLYVPDLEPTYSSSGIEVPKGSIVDGGFACIGTLVIVNIRISLTEDVAQYGTVLTGLPVPQGVNEVALVLTNRTSALSINSYGSITTGASITSGTLLLNAVYLRNLPTRTKKTKKK